MIDLALKETGVTKDHQYKLSIVMRQFFCYYEKSHKSISEITDRDFIEFIPVVANKNPHNMNCSLRSLRHLIQYLNEHKLAKITVDLKVFNPKAPPHRLIAPFTTEMKRQAIDKISTAENSVFREEEKFKYADNETVIRQLYGLV